MAKQLIKKLFQAREFAHDYQGMEACAAVKKQIQTLLKRDKTLLDLQREVAQKKEEEALEKQQKGALLALQE